MLGDSRPQLSQHAVGLFFAVVLCRPVVDLHEIDPTHRRAFSLQHLIDPARRRLFTVEPAQHWPGVKAGSHVSVGLAPGLYQSLLADPAPFAGELRRLDPGAWVVVDEIQRLPGLLNEVHRFIEERGLRFALLGSSARKLRAAGVNLLGGRPLAGDAPPDARGARSLIPITPDQWS
jgi:hypothetical protein